VKEKVAKVKLSLRCIDDDFLSITVTGITVNPEVLVRLADCGPTSATQGIGVRLFLESCGACDALPSFVNPASLWSGAWSSSRFWISKSHLLDGRLDGIVMAWIRSSFLDVGSNKFTRQVE